MATSSSRDKGNLGGLVSGVQDNSLVGDEAQRRIGGDEGGKSTWDKSVDCRFREVMFGRHFDGTSKAKSQNRAFQTRFEEEEISRLNNQFNNLKASLTRGDGKTRNPQKESPLRQHLRRGNPDSGATPLSRPGVDNMI